MNLSNRIYTRKIFYRIVYMFNFHKSILLKNIYINFADKIDNIVKHGLDKVPSEEFLKYDFSKLLVKNTINHSKCGMDDCINVFNPANEKDFLGLISYISDNIVLAKHNEAIELDYMFLAMKYLWDNYDKIILKIDEHLPTFKFLELNSITQSIILLAVVENKAIKTSKNILIKEAMLLGDTFDGENSGKLINAVLDKVLE